LAQPEQVRPGIRIDNCINHRFRTFCAPLRSIAFVSEDGATPEGAEAGFEEGQEIWADVLST